MPRLVAGHLFIINLGELIMKKLVFLIILFLLPTFLYSQNLCSIISYADENSIYIGSNLDAPNPNTKMWVVPATEDQYARLCFGFDENYRIAENGINEHGLFIDLNSADKTNWRPDPNKPNWEEWEGWYTSGVPDGILAKCKTVDEAVEIFKKYNLLTFANVKYHLADKTGNSLVLEWADDELKIIPRKTKFLISTNFITSIHQPENYPCYRYNLASRILSDNELTDIRHKLKLTLSPTAMEFNSPTQYSLLVDLTKPLVIVYFYHNFEEPLELNLIELFSRGEQKYILSELFQYKSYGYEVYSKYYNMTQSN